MAASVNVIDPFAPVVSGGAGLTPAQEALLDSAIQPGDNVSDLSNDAGYVAGESDPAFLASPAAGITAQMIADWNAGGGGGEPVTADVVLDGDVPAFTVVGAAGYPNDPSYAGAGPYSYGVTTEAGLDGETKTVVIRGPLTITGASFTPGYPVMLGAGGVIEQWNYHATSQVVGFAITSEDVYIDIRAGVNATPDWLPVPMLTQATLVEVVDAEVVVASASFTPADMVYPVNSARYWGAILPNVVSATGYVELRLYDLGEPGQGDSPRRVDSVVLNGSGVNNYSGDIQRDSAALIPVDGGTAMVADDRQFDRDYARTYELRVIIVAGEEGDTVNVMGAGLSIRAS